MGKEGAWSEWRSIKDAEKGDNCSPRTRPTVSICGFTSAVYKAGNAAAGLQVKEIRSLWVQGYPGLHSKFQTRQGYIVKPCLKQE